MATYDIGMDVHCNNTELAVEKGRKIVECYSVPMTIPAIADVLESLSGKKHLAMEEGPMAGWLCRNDLHGRPEKTDLDHMWASIRVEVAKELLSKQASFFAKWKIYSLT